MSNKSDPILAVPTNIITGFLGAGKTSTILNLLNYKPDGERWAILVNEFGEIGVDGSLVQGRLGGDNDIHIREVPGGCMCCTAGLPMQIALNQLLQRARPHRLLIEPTGLGHPLEVLQTLSSSHNREALSIQKTVALVDARNLADPRYTSHDTFRQQMAIADVVVANKIDLYGPQDRPALESFVSEVCSEQVDVVFTQYGELDPEHLAGPTSISVDARIADHDDASPLLLADDLPFPECGYVVAMNHGEGFESIGWRFTPYKIFDRENLFAFFSGLKVERMKAVFITSSGVFGYNLSGSTLSEIELDDCDDSRIEIIATQIDPDWTEELIKCLITQE